MVKLDKNEMLGISGGGFVTGLKTVVFLFSKIIYRSIFRW